jgi:hypothetical protein
LKPQKSLQDVDFDEKIFQPRVIISRISPDTLRRYSQTDSESEETTPPDTGSGGIVSEESSSSAALQSEKIMLLADNSAQLLGDPAAEWDEKAKTLNQQAENIIIEGIDFPKHCFLLEMLMLIPISSKFDAGSS